MVVQWFVELSNIGWRTVVLEVLLKYLNLNNTHYSKAPQTTNVL